jgi:hypothetical protein
VVWSTAAASGSPLATDAVDVELGEGPPGQRFEQAGLVLEMVVDGDA